MVDKLLELALCQIHETLNFCFWSVKVLQTEGINCDNLDPTLVANFQDLGTDS